MKYEKVFTEFFSKQFIFEISDARRFLLKLGANEPYVRVMLHNMVVSKKIYRVGNGTYTFNKNEAVIGFAFRPFYYGLQYALTIRKIWTQQSIPIIITKTKANTGFRNSMNTRILVRRINDKGFFGFDFVNYGGIFVPVSDPEKTYLDLSYYKIKIDDDTMSLLKDKIDELKLKEYSKKFFYK